MRRLAIVAVLAGLVALVAIHAASGSPLGLSQSGWFWGDPQPQGYGFTALDYAGGTGYAVGTGAMRLDGGGATWTPLAPGPVSSGLTQVQTVDADTVVVLSADGCAMDRSDDRGATVHSVDTSVAGACSPATGIRTFQFVDRQTGFLILDDGTVLRTDDGGRTLVRKSRLPGTRAGVNGGVDAIAFTGAERGFALIGASTHVVYSTSDGGDSWTRVDSLDATHVLFIYFFDSEHGFAIGADTLFRTDDGGRSWTPSAAAKGYYLETIRCGDPQTCVLITAVFPGSGHALLHTSDGGQTLTRSTGAQPAGSAVAFASPRRVVALGDNGKIWRSDDGGATFTPLGHSLDRNFGGLRAGPTPTSGFAFGERGALARTADGGANWSPVSVPTKADLRDVVFPTAGDAYVLDHDGALFATADAGANWKRLRTGSLRPARALAAPVRGTLVLVGPRGIFRTTSPAAPAPVGGSDVSAAALSAVVQRQGLLVAYGQLSRNVFRSLDDGATWQRIPLPAHTSVKGRLGLDFVDSKTGFFVDSRQRLWETTSGGRRWAPVLGVGSNDVWGVVMMSAQEGYAALRGYAGASDRAVVLRTSDGGVTWRPQMLSIGPLRSLVATDAQTAFALVGKQYLLFTQSGGDMGRPATITLDAGKVVNGRVTVSGSLPVSAGGERIVVSKGNLDGTGWTHQVVSAVGTAGRFATTWRIRHASAFVAQWIGDANRTSAASRSLVVRVSTGRR